MRPHLVPSVAVVALGCVGLACPAQLSDSGEEAPTAASKSAKAKDTGEKKAAKPKKKPKKKKTKADDSDVHRRFRKGQLAPPGLSEAELQAFAKAQGDPAGGVFTFQQAVEGDAALADPSAGKLIATFETTMGKFDCELYEDKAPGTVANFVGLARGTRPYQDPKTDEWVKGKYYEGIIFHRVIANFMIQTGDPTGTGRGGPGYVIADEFGEGLLHRGKGLLSMANRGKNTGSSQFFITVADTPHLDGKHAIFGKCDEEIPVKISEVDVDPRQGNRPKEEISIKAITFSRRK